MISTDKDRLDAYFRSIYEHSRQRMPRNLKTPEAAAMLEEFEEGISVLVDRLALRLSVPPASAGGDRTI